MREPCLSLLMMTCSTMLGAERPAFQTLRYNEDWSFLQDSSRRADWLDPVKFVPLDGTNWRFREGVVAEPE